MVCYGNVVHAEKFVARKTQKTYTKLFVPVGFEVYSVICEGDFTHLSGVSDVEFHLGLKDGNLKLYYREEDTNA